MCSSAFASLKTLKKAHSHSVLFCIFLGGFLVVFEEGEVNFLPLRIQLHLFETSSKGVELEAYRDLEWRSKHTHLTYQDMIHVVLCWKSAQVGCIRRAPQTMMFDGGWKFNPEPDRVVLFQNLMISIWSLLLKETYIIQ